MERRGPVMRASGPLRRASVAVAAAGLAAACREAPAPYPSVELFVDTDLPVPTLASHLRVDV